MEQGNLTTGEIL